MTSPSPPSEPSEASPPGPPGKPRNGNGNGNGLTNQKVRNAVALVITLTWAGGIIADALSTTFELSPFVYMTQLGLAAALFGGGFVKGIK